MGSSRQMSSSSVFSSSPRFAVIRQLGLQRLEQHGRIELGGEGGAGGLEQRGGSVRSARQQAVGEPALLALVAHGLQRPPEPSAKLQGRILRGRERHGLGVGRAGELDARPPGRRYAAQQACLQRGGCPRVGALALDVARRDRENLGGDRGVRERQQRHAGGVAEPARLGLHVRDEPRRRMIGGRRGAGEEEVAVEGPHHLPADERNQSLLQREGVAAGRVEELAAQRVGQ